MEQHANRGEAMGTSRVCEFCGTPVGDGDFETADNGNRLFFCASPECEREMAIELETQDTDDRPGRY